MKPLVDQIRTYAEYAEEALPWVEPANIAASQRPDEAIGSPERPDGRPPGRRAVLVTAAAVVVLLGLAAAIVYRVIDQSDPTPAEVEVVDDPSPPAPGVVESGLGSFEWTLIEGADTEIPPVEWSRPAMGFNGSEYFQWISCAQVRGPDDPVVPSELWSSSDGLRWTRFPVPCDTSIEGVGDSLVMSPFPGEPLVSTDAESWTPLFADPETGPRGLVWEVDDPETIFEMTAPWGIGGFAPTGWLFEFDDGVSATQVNRAGGRRDGRLTTWTTFHTFDGHEWTELEHPEFVQQGYDSTDGSLYNAIAHQDGVAIVVFNNGTDYRMWRSDDGLVWSDVTPETLTSGGVWAAGDLWLQGLEFFEGIGSSASFLMSEDGDSWQRVQLPTELADFEGTVRAVGNKIFVFGEDLLVGSYTPEGAQPQQDAEASATTLPTTSGPVSVDETDVARTPAPDIAGALVGDDGANPQSLGVVSELPPSERLNLLFEDCGNLLPGCHRTAMFMSPDRPGFGSGRWPADRPFHVRHGFINDGPALPAGFTVSLFITPWGGSGRSPSDLDLGQTYKYVPDYVLRGTSDQCGPTYKAQTEPTVCEWFVHDFPDGLPMGSYSIWAVWQAPCAAWLELGLIDVCDDPEATISQFSAGSNLDIGFESASFDQENEAQWSVARLWEEYGDEYED